MARKPNPRPDVDEAIALMQQGRTRGRGRRSPIMVWMQQNRTALEAAFAHTAPAWAILASYLGERGITDGDGKPPTARTAREAWGRVKAMASSATPASAVPVAPSIVEESVSPPSAPRDLPGSGSPENLQPVSPLAADGARPAPHPRFGGPATLRNHTPAVAPASPPPPMPTAPRQDSKAVIKALLSRGRPTGFRKPDPEDE